MASEAFTVTVTVTLAFTFMFTYVQWQVQLPAKSLSAALEGTLVARRVREAL